MALQRKIPVVVDYLVFFFGAGPGTRGMAAGANGPIRSCWPAPDEAISTAEQIARAGRDLFVLATPTVVSPPGISMP